MYPHRIFIGHYSGRGNYCNNTRCFKSSHSAEEILELARQFLERFAKDKWYVVTQTDCVSFSDFLVKSEISEILGDDVNDKTQLSTLRLAAFMDDSLKFEMVNVFCGDEGDIGAKRL